MKASHSDCYEGVPAASLTSCAARHKSLGTAWYKLGSLQLGHKQESILVSVLPMHFSASSSSNMSGGLGVQSRVWILKISFLAWKQNHCILACPKFSLKIPTRNKQNKKQTNKQKKNKTVLPQNPSSINTLFLLAQLSRILQFFNIHSALSTRKLNISYLLHWTFF